MRVNGQVFTWEGKSRSRMRVIRADARPLEEDCGCAACRGGYSRAYLRHLYLQGETLVLSMLSDTNLHFYEQVDGWSARRHRAG